MRDRLRHALRAVLGQYIHVPRQAVEYWTLDPEGVECVKRSLPDKLPDEVFFAGWYFSRPFGKCLEAIPCGDHHAFHNAKDASGRKKTLSATGCRCVLQFRRGLIGQLSEVRTRELSFAAEPTTTHRRRPCTHVVLSNAGMTSLHAAMDF